MAPLRVVVIGGVAAGPKVASKIIRLHPEAEVTVIEKGVFLSYAGCGLPYYVSGVVHEQKELMATPAGTVRDPVFFQKVKNVQVLNRTEATAIDRAARTVRVRALEDGAERTIPYDKLILCTGASSFTPPIPGRDSKGVFSLYGVEDAEGIRAALAEERARDVVVIGGGLIGVEITEALIARGCRVTIVEMVPQILGFLDEEMARLVTAHMESKGVKVRVRTKVEEILAKNGAVAGVRTDAGELAADMVIMAVGVRPNATLAKEAGLEIGPSGGIAVDDHQRTSDPNILAAGDCCQMRHLVDGQPAYVPLGSTANKMGRVAANVACGREDRFPGVLGSCVCKVFDFAVGATGLCERKARAAGYDVTIVLAPAPDKAHFMPEAQPLLMKLVVDKATRKLLGAQAVGPGAADKRIDVAAMALTAGMTVDDLAQADLCYAPPFSPAMDNILTAANIARNKLDGFFEGISPSALQGRIDSGSNGFVLLDNRSPEEFAQVRLAGSINLPLGKLRGEGCDLPKETEIICLCKISLRGYEGALILKSLGYEKVKVLDGGIAMWPYAKEIPGAACTT